MPLSTPFPRYPPPHAYPGIQNLLYDKMPRHGCSFHTHGATRTDVFSLKNPTAHVLSHENGIPSPQRYRRCNPLPIRQSRLYAHPTRISKLPHRTLLSEPTPRYAPNIRKVQKNAPEDLTFSKYEAPCPYQKFPMV